MLARMTMWTRKYSDDQRAAVERAALDLAITPRTRIAAMAAAGELRPDAGSEPLEPFDIPASTVRAIADAAKRRRSGRKMPAELAKMPARDRAATFQHRLSALIDAELTRLERDARYGRRPLDLEAARKVARALRELATIPDPHEIRLPRTPGDRVPGTGERPDGKTSGGLAGQLLQASSRHAAATDVYTHGDAAADDTPLGDNVGDGETTRDNHHDHDHELEHDDTAREHEHDDADRDGDDAGCSRERTLGSGVRAVDVLEGISRR